jgi:hypothetical protein
MTAPDRTEELVLEMLARRAGGDVPPDLLGRTLAALAVKPQARTSGHHPAASRGRRSRSNLLLVAGMVVGFVALLSALLAAGLLPGQPDDGPGIAAVGSLEPAATTDASIASASPGDTGQTPPSTVASPGVDLAPGSIAVVTLEGERLRVRSLPTTDNSRSKRYTPLLPPGTRMLVVGGPVIADGMTWYEVQTDGELIDLFGWVSSGQDGETWIEPRAPRCPEHVDAATVATLTRIDFLACYGNRTVEVLARVEDLWAPRGEDPACGWILAREGTDCRIDTRWLLFPDAEVTLVTDHGNLHDIVLALPPDYAAALRRLPPQATSVLTIAMDAPEAASCRARNGATGKDLITVDHAITRCRLQFAVQRVFLLDADAASPG